MNSNHIRTLLLCLAACVAVPAVAQDKTGADTFKERCVLCHGEDGRGDTPTGKAFKAASLRDPAVTGKSNDDLHNVVKNGKNNMPAFKASLTDAQIDAVIAYVRKLK